MLEGGATLKPNYPPSVHFVYMPKICNKMCVFHMFAMRRRHMQSRATRRQCCFAHPADARRQVGLPKALSPSLSRPQKSNLETQLVSFPWSIFTRKIAFPHSFRMAK